MSNQPFRASTIGTTSWKELRLHVLLQVVNAPASGGGAIPYLGLINSGLTALHEKGGSAWAGEWLDVAKQVSKQLILLKEGKLAAPTSHDLADPIWDCLHKCIATRNRNRGHTHFVDALLAQGILHAIANKVTIALPFLKGIAALYKCIAERSAHRDWYSLLGPKLLSQDALVLILPILSNSPTQRFAVQCIAILASPIVRVSSVHLFVNHQQAAFTQLASDHPTSSEGIDSKPVEYESNTSVHVDLLPDEETPGEKRRFQAGDSILQWHATKAAFAHRNERLGLQAWESLPPEMTVKISSSIAAILQSDSIKNKPVASVTILSLLTSTPLRVLLHASLKPGTDFYVDIRQGCICWSRAALLSNARADGSTVQTEFVSDSKDRIFRIPLPEILALELQRLHSLRGESNFLYEVFSVSPDTPECDALATAVRILLQKLGDPAFPAHPGRWCNSVARVDLESIGSDLMSAACCLSLSLSSIGAMHYFHPSSECIANACKDTFNLMALGELSSTFKAGSSVYTDLPSDNELVQGFWEMEQEMRRHFACIRTRASLEKRIEAFNALVRLTAASLVFFSAGRGSKIEDIRAGSVFLLDELLNLGDKEVADERGSRLLPKTKQLRLVLQRLGHAQCLVAGLISDLMIKKQGDIWRELSLGKFRFDAIAFQIVEISKGAYTRQPLKAIDIEVISQNFFGRPKNFMRHVVITSWSVARLDCNLLRLITGHATSGLQVPAVASTYSPLTAISSAGAPLEQLLARWVPSPDPSSVALSFRPDFPGLPGRSIHKIHRAHRDDLLLCVSGPRYDRWHVAALAIVNAVRKRLLKAGPTDPAASLWLHLLCFDGLHDENDLALIFSDLPQTLELGEKGWVYRFRRHGNANAHINPVQVPTATLLHGHSTSLKACLSSDYEKTIATVSDWLGATFPQFWGKSEEHPAKVSQALLLVASVKLWCDLCVPTCLQYAYEPTSHSAMLDASSANRIFGLAGSARVSVQDSKLAHRNFNGDAQLEKLLLLIDEIGDNKKKFGELAARASLMSERLVKLGDMAQNTWSDLLSRAVKINIEMIRAGSKDRLEFSSLSTYVGYLKPNIMSMSADRPGDFDELDWILASQCLRVVQPHEKQPSTERQLAQHNATTWLLKSVNESGIPIPPQAIAKNAPRVLLPSRSNPIAHVEDHQLASIRAVIQQWFHEDPLNSLRADLAIEMLSSGPMRWGELSCIAAQDFFHSMPLFCIQPAGFSQIKSHLSRRFLSLSPVAKALFENIKARLSASQPSSTANQFIFLVEVQGVVNGTTADWLHDAITTAMRAFTGNPNARVHGLRGRRVSEEMYPGWRALLGLWLDGALGPVMLGKYFEYSQETAWRTDISRCAAGHSQDRTTVGFYLYPNLQIRALALAATLTDFRPTAAIISVLSSESAFKKQQSRVVAVRNDPWIFLQQRTPKRHRPKDELLLKFDAPLEAEQRILPVESYFIANIPDIQYTALRLAGCDTNLAADLTATVTSRVMILEERISDSLSSATDLRKRVRGSQNGRAMKADIQTIQSDSGLHFAALTWKLNRSGCETLLALLTQRAYIQPWHEALLEIESYFQGTPWAIESICDHRFEDLSISVKLNRYENLIAGAPQRAVGLFPRMFVCLKAPENNNKVVKARLTVMARLQCQAFLLLSQHSTKL